MDPQGGKFDLAAILKSWEHLGMSDDRSASFPRLRMAVRSCCTKGKEYCVAFFKQFFLTLISALLLYFLWEEVFKRKLDITSGISEIKLLISDFTIVDFRFSRIAICDFGFLNSGFRFLISEFSFQVSEFWFLNCHLQYRVNHGLKIKYFRSKIRKT